MKNKKKIAIGVVLTLLVVLAGPVYVFCDIIFHGPQVVRFNKRCEQIVEEQHLIGQSPTAVETSLGIPTSIYSYDEVGSFTYNYAPHPSFPFAKFQAHFKDGKLKSIELYDD